MELTHQKMLKSSKVFVLVTLICTIYGVRPRDERTMCVNGYSGTPNIEEFRNLLKEGFNPLADLDKEYNDFIEEENDWMEECKERDFFESNPSKDEILSHNPEYEKYFA